MNCGGFMRILFRSNMNVFPVTLFVLLALYNQPYCEALLAQPHGTMLVPISEDSALVLAMQLERTAVALDLKAPGKWPLCIDQLRWRYEPARNYPYSLERHRFPDSWIAGKNCEFNRSYQRQVEYWHAQGKLDHFVTQMILAECERIHAIWDCVKYINAPNVDADPFHVRQWLQELRELLGPEDFYTGRLPNYVPLEYFMEIR